jgi:alpha-glucosidase
MNEPAVMEVPNTFPMDVRHDYDGNPCSHRKAHNIYGTQMARATYHGVKDLLTRKGLLLSQDLLMQAQRYSSSWTGDNGYLGAFMDCKHTSPKDVNFWNGILV